MFNKVNEAFGGRFWSVFWEKSCSVLKDKLKLIRRVLGMKTTTTTTAQIHLWSTAEPDNWTPPGLFQAVFIGSGVKGEAGREWIIFPWKHSSDQFNTFNENNSLFFTFSSCSDFSFLFLTGWWWNLWSRRSSPWVLALDQVYPLQCCWGDMGVWLSRPHVFHGSGEVRAPWGASFCSCMEVHFVRTPVLPLLTSQLRCRCADGRQLTLRAGWAVTACEQRTWYNSPPECCIALVMSASNNWDQPVSHEVTCENLSRDCLHLSCLPVGSWSNTFTPHLMLWVFGHFWPLHPPLVPPVTLHHVCTYLLESPAASWIWNPPTAPRPVKQQQIQRAITFCATIRNISREPDPPGPCWRSPIKTPFMPRVGSCSNKMVINSSQT